MVPGQTRTDVIPVRERTTIVLQGHRYQTHENILVGQQTMRQLVDNSMVRSFILSTKCTPSNIKICETAGSLMIYTKLVVSINIHNKHYTNYYTINM